MTQHKSFGKVYPRSLCTSNSEIADHAGGDGPVHQESRTNVAILALIEDPATDDNDRQNGTNDETDNFGIAPVCESSVSGT